MDFRNGRCYTVNVMLGIYCRTSRKESISGVETIEQQIQAGVKFAESNNLNYTIYEDSGKSGYIEKSKEDPFSARPAFKQLLADIDAGKINEVWVWELSRLARRNKYYATVIDSLAENKIILNVLSTRIDLTDTMQRAMVEMQGVWAQVERQEIVARTSRGKAAATDRGALRHGSMYGYTTDKDSKITTPNNEELEIVKNIYTDYLDGLNLREIGKKYFVGNNAETAKLLSVVKKVKQILAHEEYTGQNLKIAGRQIEKDFEEEKISDIQDLLNNDYWVDSNFYTEKIIDRETWIKAREKLELTRRSLSKGTAEKRTRERNRSLASGFLKCAICGNNYYFKDVGLNRGGKTYLHLRTVDKCSQIPSQMKMEKLDSIFDVIYTFYYLILDDTADRLKEMKLGVKEKSKTIKKELADLEAVRKKKTAFLNNVETSIAEGMFEDDIDAFKEAMKTLAHTRKEVESITLQINLKQNELEENSNQEKYLSRSEKYKLTTIERLQKWFDLREKNSYAELRSMFKEIVFDGMISISENIIEVIVGNPGRSFYFDIKNDYKIIYPFIEKVIDRKLNVTYSEVEELWLKEKTEAIESFGQKVKQFLAERPERKRMNSFGETDYEETFGNNNFLFLEDVFTIEPCFTGLGLFTKAEENLTGTKAYTTEEVSKILNVPKSTLREWAGKKGIKSVRCSDGRLRLQWTDSDIELYKKSPHKHIGNKGYKFTEEQLAHLSKVRKGRKPSEETKRKRSESMKKKWAEMSEEEKQKRKSGLDPFNKKK